MGFPQGRGGRAQRERKRVAKHGFTREPTTKVTTATEDWHSGKDGRDEPEVAAQIAQHENRRAAPPKECNREDIRTWQF